MTDLYTMDPSAFSTQAAEEALSLIGSHQTAPTTIWESIKTDVQHTMNAMTKPIKDVMGGYTSDIKNWGRE